MKGITEFSVMPAPHIPRQPERVLVQRFEDGKEVNRGWFERHRLYADSPTGVNTIIELLRRKDADV